MANKRDDYLLIIPELFHYIPAPPNTMERLIEEAAQPFERKVLQTYKNGTCWNVTFEGWSNRYTDGEPPKAVKAAICNAIPLPVTIREAAREYAAWEQRDEERRLLAGHRFPFDSYLSKACALRYDIVRELLETGLRATCIADVAERQRYYMACGCQDSEIENAVLADLEHLLTIEP